MSKRLGMLKHGDILWDVNIGRGAGLETDMAIWGMFILWGWGSFGTDIGYVNIVGGRGPGTEFGDVNIVGAREGEGVGGQTLGMLIWGGGLGTEIPVQDSSETVRLSPRTLFGPPKSPGE